MSNSIFINMALLETIRARNSGYFVDHFINFLCVATYTNKIEELTVDTCQKLLEREFGLNIPQASVGLILNRASKKNYFIKLETKYTPLKNKIDPIAERFLKQKEDLIRQQKQLISSLVEYAKTEHSVEIIESNAELLLLDFFKKYQYELTVRDSTKFAIGTAPGVKNPEHLVSLFVTENYKKKSEVSKIIEIVTKGYFVANFINIRGTETDTNNLKGLTVILDTPILMGLHDFNGKLRRDACIEMIKLGTSLGVKFIVFEHIFEEWESIFHAWVNDLRNKNFKAFNSATLALLNARGMDATAIEAMIPRLTSKLDELGIKIIDRPPQNPAYSIGEPQLMEHLKKAGIPDTNGRLERDIQTVSGIVQLRKGKSRLALHENPTVFITTNAALIREVNAFMSLDISDKSVQLVNSDVWLTNLCWMISPNVFPELPHQYLIANCYSAMNSDDRFWDSFLSRLRRLKSENIISGEDYKLVRYEVDLKVCIKEMSIKVGTEFSDEAALNAVKETKNKVLKQKNDVINKLERKNELVEQRVKFVSDKFANISSWLLLIILTLSFAIFSYNVWLNQNSLFWFSASVLVAIASLWFDVSLFRRRLEIKLKLSIWWESKISSFIGL